MYKLTILSRILQAALMVVIMTITVPVRAQWKSRIPKVDSVMNYLYERQLFNGSILLAEKGKVIYSKTSGVAGPDGKPLTSSAAFNLASVSKQFYAMMIMMLKEDNKLTFDDAVQQYLPTFPYPHITIRQLMNQTSGLPEYFDIADRDMNLVDTLTNERMLALFAEKRPPLVSRPGDKFRYCNSNYITLASVIEAVSGMTCDQFFASRIAKPLGLRNSYIYDLTMKSFPASRVLGFRYSGGKRILDDLIPFDGIVGDGNVYASAQDLLTWVQALQGSKLVSQATFSEAITPALLNDGSKSYYGFGWEIRKDGKEISHRGGWAGFRAIISHTLTTNQTYVLLDNSTTGTVLPNIKQILDGESFVLPVTQLINNVRLIDGTGLPAYNASVRVVNDRIGDIGDLTAFRGEPVVDGKGYVLAPGFIDSHSHLGRSLPRNPAGFAAISQGITTIIIGQDGGSDPIDTVMARIRRRPAAVNIATYTGHASLRERVMRDVYKKADTVQINAMKVMLASEMEKGSFGLSTGLEYEEGFYATRDEVIALARIAAAHNGRYISHMRSEDMQIERSIEELIDIGKEAGLPVQISHIKIAMRSKWGNSRRIIARLERARAEGVNVTADCYPYRVWSSTPRVLFPKKDFTNERSARFATEELFDPAQSIILTFPGRPEYAGKTVKDIATMNHESEAKALMRIIRESGASDAALAGASMSEEDIENFLAWDHTNICSDGTDGGHPRGYGSFTRILGYYVREKKLFPLETAIHRMTGLTAEHLGITNRGVVARGNFADLVLFNPATVKDNATMDDPTAQSSGIERVWVNGQQVLAGGRPVAGFPGQFITAASGRR